MHRRLWSALISLVLLGLLGLPAPGNTLAAASSNDTPAGGKVVPADKVGTAEPVCGPATPDTWQCLALRRTDIAGRPASDVSATSAPFGFGPADLASAYALPSSSAGTGMTVAVVDAYDLPSAEADLAVYRAQYGLPPCTTANGCFRKVDQNGGTSYPAADAGWGQEIALDIEMVSATCPNCHILLVEARSAYTSDLGTGVNTAVALGAVAVSNSYGGPEDSGSETTYDAYFNHPGVAITASHGRLRLPLRDRLRRGQLSGRLAVRGRGGRHETREGRQCPRLDRVGMGRCPQPDRSRQRLLELRNQARLAARLGLLAPHRGRCLGGRRSEHRGGRL